MLVIDTAAPSTALPIGKQTTMSPTRLTKVDPSTPATIHRLQNAILGLILVSDQDKRMDIPERKPKRVKKEVVEEMKEEMKGEEVDVKVEGAVEKQDHSYVPIKPEGDDAQVEGSEATAEVKADDEEEDEDSDDEEEEPIWEERVSWREAAGFLAMYVSLYLMAMLLSEADDRTPDFFT